MSNKCPNCGKPVPTSALQGLCPECMLQLGAASQTDTGGETGPHGTRVTKAPPPLDEIARHFPQFEILECLGRGGMGVVYKARQPKLNRIVALKILAPEKVAETRFAERFEREAQALARLNHPNIVTVYDFGETDGLYYLTMEFVDGASLRQLLQTRKIAPEEALAIVPKICEALQFAHDQGVVHRDIKPENVLLDKRGRVKIADFGIAKIVGEAGRAGSPLPAEAPQPENAMHPAGAGRPTAPFTQDQILGTPNYMAPEQVEHPQTVDHRADIYSLGVVFYEMLTGELPLGKFQPPSRACGKVQIDVRLDEIVLRALEKKPELRYQQASVLRTDVETVAATPQPPLKSTALSAPMNSGQRHGTALQSRESSSATGRASATRWMFLLGSGWILLAIILLLGRTVARTQPLMYAFFGIGGWMYPSGYNAIIGLTILAGLFCLWLGWVGGRGSSGWPADRLSLAMLGASPWLLVMITLMLGKKWVRSNPTMYAFYDVGGWMYPSTYNALIGACVLLALASFGVIWFRGHRYQHTGDEKVVTKGTNVLSPPRFSRKAIWGAILAPFGLLTLILPFLFASISPQAGQVSARSFLHVLPLVLLGLVALFGTTILGWISVSQIRRSAGRLYGLGLAVFDGLMFPLLALDAFIGGVWVGVARLIGDFYSNPSVLNNPQDHPVLTTQIANLLWQHPEIAILIAVATAIVVDFFIIRRVWRKVNQPLDGKPPTAAATGVATPQKTAPRWRVGWIIAGVVCGLALLWFAIALIQHGPVQRVLQPKALQNAATRSQHPPATSISKNNHSAVIYHDNNVSLSFALFHAGRFSSHHQDTNLGGTAWLDNGGITLVNGRTFGYRRESWNPEQLQVNGREFDLRAGRVLVLRNDGTVEQLRLFPSLAAARDLEELSRLIAAQRQPADNHAGAMTFGPVIERVIAPQGKEPWALNLASGSVVTSTPKHPLNFPFGLTDDNGALRAAGVDLYESAFASTAWSLKALDLRLVSLGMNGWTTSADEVVARLRESEEPVSVVRSEVWIDGRNAFAFHTRDDAKGVLQVVKDASGPAKLRYKLVQSSRP
jgi:serine/threonine protein kinase